MYSVCELESDATAKTNELDNDNVHNHRNTICNSKPALNGLQVARRRLRGNSGSGTATRGRTLPVYNQTFIYRAYEASDALAIDSHSFRRPAVNSECHLFPGRGHVTLYSYIRIWKARVTPFLFDLSPSGYNDSRSPAVRQLMYLESSL